MANKPLQSIKFPGLSDTYIVPQIDNTLTQTGQAADAGAVKDAIWHVAPLKWFRGWYGASAGLLNVAQTTAIASDLIIPQIKRISCTSTYKFRVQAWQKGIYKGIWNGTKFVTSNPNYYMSTFDVAAFMDNYPDYLFAIVLFRVDGGTVDLSEGVNVTAIMDQEHYTETVSADKAWITYGGYDINPNRHGVSRIGYEQTITGLPSGTTSRQGMDIYNDICYILASNNAAAVYDINTSTKITDIAIDCGHGNSCQFAGTVESGETIPHLFCWGYNDGNIYENSIDENNVATLVKTYHLPIEGTRISGGYDVNRDYFMTLNYSKDSSTDPVDNPMMLCVWDRGDLTDNGDGTYTPALVSQYVVPFVGAVQDCKVINGLLYVLSGLTTSSATKYKQTRIHVYNDTALLNSLNFGNASNEPEGLAYYKGKLYFASSRFYILTFL